MTVVKWSKTLQNRSKTATVSIPVLQNSPLCPVDALLTMSNALPASCDSPLFQISRAGVLSPLTDSRARKHLKHVSSVLGLQKPLLFMILGELVLPGPSSMGFHYRISRHRGLGRQNAYGATYTFHLQVLLGLLLHFVPTFLPSFLLGVWVCCYQFIAPSGRPVKL